MIKKISVYNKTNDLLAEFTISFLQRKANELKLDPKSFYEQYGNEIPDETVEMMINSGTPYWIPGLIKAKTHIHQGSDNKYYICYTKKIPSLEKAMEIAKDWCLWTVFHMQERADVNWFILFVEWVFLASPSNKEMPDEFKAFPLWIREGQLQWTVTCI